MQFPKPGRRKVFVFGSNLLGMHAGGAAAFAVRHHGAVAGNGSGIQGDPYEEETSYAIATCRIPGEGLALGDVEKEVKKFIEYARAHPALTFQVTQVGCGVAGFTKEEIAPLFREAPENCEFDSEWKPFLGKKRKYWGTY